VKSRTHGLQYIWRIREKGHFTGERDNYYAGCLVSMAGARKNLSSSQQVVQLHWVCESLWGRCLLPESIPSAFWALWLGVTGMTPI
jgi:hypothetical protein